jgi:transcriptional regulator with XRE-family HTH domain
MRLDLYLEKNEIPVEEFADQIGVHRTSIYRFMKGIAFPRPSTIRLIRTATLGAVTAEDFVELAPFKARKRRNTAVSRAIVRATRAVG